MPAYAMRCMVSYAPSPAVPFVSAAIASFSLAATNAPPSLPSATHHAATFVAAVSATSINATSVASAFATTARRLH